MVVTVPRGDRLTLRRASRSPSLRLASTGHRPPRSLPARPRRRGRACRVPQPERRAGDRHLGARPRVGHRGPPRRRRRRQRDQALSHRGARRADERALRRRGDHPEDPYFAGGRIVTCASLLREIWGPIGEMEEGSLRVRLSSIRRKMERDPSRPRLLFTEPGIGYRLKGGNPACDSSVSASRRAPPPAARPDGELAIPPRDALDFRAGKPR